MATGHQNQLTRQIGEHLVAAELGRRGYVATPLAGNVPVFDLLVATSSGNALAIQVKAIRGASWQFRVNSYLDVKIENGRQIIEGPAHVAYSDLICIFVLVAEYGHDQFYIFQWSDLQKHFLKTYLGGIRPKNPHSLHCAVWPKDLDAFLGNWGLINNLLGSGPR